jgi:septum formation protein
MKVILGSASPRRKEILTQAGIDFKVIISDCEEVITKNVPSEVVKELSRQKAEDVWEKAAEEYGSDDLLVIGADTIVAFGHTIYGKPVDEEDAVRMLKTLSGATHQVYTGVTVITKDMAFTFADCTDVTMYEVSDKEIHAYVRSGEPMDKAGAYAIQGGYARYIKEIKGEYNNVVGFPVARLIYELKQRGLDI